MQQSEPYLSFRGIGKTFPGVNALTDISFDCYAGQVHALMGENGAGKSTLLKILSGNYAPTTGTLALKGEEVSFSDTTAALNAGVAIIYQELHLVPEMTVAENIYLGQLPHKGGFVNRSLQYGDALDDLLTAIKNKQNDLQATHHVGADNRDIHVYYLSETIT
jgi:L-arabinose transport system ATP-binding protein